MRKSWLVIGSLCLVSVAQAQKLPDGKGKETVEAACDGCHGLEQIIGRTWSADKWRDVVKKMVDKGAVLSDEEFKTVVDYLAANFGEAPAKPKALRH
jgi:cytochrome c5